MNEIVVGVDRSATSHRALDEAVEMARACGRGIHVVTAVAERGERQEIRSGRDVLSVTLATTAERDLEVLLRARDLDVPVTTKVVRGDIAKGLVAEAERIGASMIVVGNRRVQGATRVLGSVATDVARQAGCNVLIAYTT